MITPTNNIFAENSSASASVRATVTTGVPTSVQVPVPAVAIEHLTHRYGQRVALDDLSLTVYPGEIFGLLGPNGSGKSTLFRILSTLMPSQSGKIQILGMSLPEDQQTIRQNLGVLFQSPSVDLRLTVAENLRHHGHLYGLRGSLLKSRMDELLTEVGLADRASDLVGKLSGGQRRRIELAGCLMLKPRLLILDEPSTGLDPAARIDLWRLYRQTSSHGITLLLTTHMMDEADQCDRLGFLDNGKLIACDTPSALKDTVGGNIVTLVSDDPQATVQTLQTRLGITATIIDNTVRFEKDDAHLFIPQLMETLTGTVSSVSVSRPTLDDVFRKMKRD